MSSFTTSHKFATSWENSQSQLPIVSLSSHGFRQVLGQRLFLHPGQMAFAGPMMSTSLVSKDIRYGNNLFFPELSHFDVHCLYRPGLQFHRFIGQTVQICVWLPNPAPENSFFYQKILPVLSSSCLSCKISFASKYYGFL